MGEGKLKQQESFSEFSVMYTAAGHATRVSLGPDTLVHFSCLTALRQK